MIVEKISKLIFGSKNERDIKSLLPIVDKITRLEPEIDQLSDDQLKEKTIIFRERLKNGETLDDILPEAFAVVREASKRVLHMRHFEVQLMGGIVLHHGKISEMKTGEGKTLVATLPVYLNALSGEGVHVVTVNDYLARRDKEWMGPLYEFLGLTIGVINHGMTNEERKEAYACDITYGTNNEMGFDYLRDNMVPHKDRKVQRGFNFCIVDEVDSILIDEARTPLIISGPTEGTNEEYIAVNKFVPKLKVAERGEDGKWIDNSGDFIMDEKDRYVALTEQGISKMEKFLSVENLYSDEYVDTVHKINNSLKAHFLFSRDKDYIVEVNPETKKQEVIIVDEHTGRKMFGRRYSDGLHQALEAKERVPIKRDTQTYATITFQNYFRMYNKLAGMTGTAETEAVEFKKIYDLDVVVIATNEPVRRIDFPDRVYLKENDKFKAIINEIEECHQSGQPVLVGTLSVEKSELIASLLKKRGIPHNVLNAKNHEKEALVIAQAGQKGAVTIATNMAGRGTDIKLAEGVVEAGGLHVLGSERHESRRIDNQLRGRSGRQGDPGSSRFYLSLEDDLLRLFGPDRLDKLSARMKMLGMEDDQEIEHNLLSKGIERAQQKVEGRNFEIRKHLLEYDDVMNQQRTFAYELRDKILYNDDLKDEVIGMLEDIIYNEIESVNEDAKSIDQEEAALITNGLYELTRMELSVDENKRSFEVDNFADILKEQLLEKYGEKEDTYGTERMRNAERIVMLRILDAKWKEHLYIMDSIKEGIGWRSYAQKDPLVEYKREGSIAFEDMRFRMIKDIISTVFKMQIRVQTQQEIERQRQINTAMSQLQGREQKQEVGQFGIMRQSSANASAQKPMPRQAGRRSTGGRSSAATRPAPQSPVIAAPKIGRNDPCPCGSGKKYKHCCGSNS